MLRRQIIGKNKEPYMAALVSKMIASTTTLMPIKLMRKKIRYFICPDLVYALGVDF